MERGRERKVNIITDLNWWSAQGKPGKLWKIIKSFLLAGKETNVYWTLQQYILKVARV